MLTDPRTLRQDSDRREADAAGRATSVPSMLHTYRSIQFQGHGDAALGAVTFDAPFLQEPSFTSGVALLVPPDPALWRLPQATALLRGWRTDGKGFFIGADLDVSVFCAPQPNVFPTESAWVSLVFHVVFIGVGFKDATTADLSGPTVRS